MAEGPNPPPSRPSPLSRLPVRTFRQTQSGTVPKPAPLPKANTPAPTAGSRPTLPSVSSSSRMPTIVLIEHDTACGILAGIFEPGPYTVTPEAITELNPSGKAPQTQKYWLKPNDVVGAVTRMYLAARQALSEMPEQAAPNLQPGQRTQQMKARDDANARLQELKRQLYDILRFRDAIEKANRAGFRLIYTPPEPPATGRRSSK